MKSKHFTFGKELADLGFVNQSKAESGICGCNTVPCFQGKMPYDPGDDVPCAIASSYCNESPVEHMRRQKQRKRH